MSEPPVNPPKQIRTYQPTFQLNPRKRFNVENVEKLLKKIVDPELQEVEYNDKVVSELCISLAGTIRDAIKEEKYDRSVTFIHKFCVFYYK